MYLIKNANKVHLFDNKKVYKSVIIERNNCYEKTCYYRKWF